MFQKEESQRKEETKTHEKSWIRALLLRGELAPTKEDSLLPDPGSDMISWISELLWTREPYAPPVLTFPTQNFRCIDLVSVLPLYVDVWKTDYISL